MDGLSIIVAALRFQNAPAVYRANRLSVILKDINAKESLFKFLLQNFPLGMEHRIPLLPPSPPM
jgi:hypothetical protein